MIVSIHIAEVQVVSILTMEFFVSYKSSVTDEDFCG